VQQAASQPAVAACLCSWPAVTVSHAAASSALLHTSNDLSDYVTNYHQSPQQQLHSSIIVQKSHMTAAAAAAAAAMLASISSPPKAQQHGDKIEDSGL
jgi:hypothetical protein